MKQKRSFVLLFLLSSVLVTTGCAPSMQINQVRFGIKAAESNLWDEALFRWKKALAENPNNAAAYNNLGVAYERKGLLKEAEEAYLHALELDPNNKQIIYNHQKLMGLREDENEKKSN